MEIEEEDSKNFKELIIPKIKKSTSDLINNKHSRIALCDFSSIMKRKLGSDFLFYNKIYLNKNLDYFNEEEDTDFLIFERNNVYIDYSDNLFTFHKVDEEEKILEVDLDNEEIISPNREKNEDCEDSIEHKTDLITLSYFPLCISHCNITLCYEQDLPQVLSTELIVQFMNIYHIVNNPSLICGYDSLGAGCIINHLHFEFLMLDDFGKEIPFLPIEKRKSKLIFETQLKYKNESEISLFDGTTLLKVGVIEYPVNCWKIECKDGSQAVLSGNGLKEMENSYQNSIGRLANLILSKLIDKEVPHNLILTNQGTCFYLIPRKFEDKKHEINTCWNDLAGLVTCKEENTFEIMSQEKVDEFLKKEISMEDDKFKEITEDIVRQVESIYEIKKY